jgi:hypothetical protein
MIENGSNSKTALVTVLVAALGLSACADEVPVAKLHHRTHVSPPFVEPPVLPAGSFDQARAAQRLLDGKEALQRGDLGAAQAATEQALASWPVAIEGWEQLIELCQRQDDQSCRRYATFYHAKLVMLNGLPMRAAALGFESVAANPPGTKVDDTVYDQRMLDMATRLWVFCSREDPSRATAPEPTETSFVEAYPYAPTLLVIGIAAGLLTGIKAVANK